MLLLRITRKLFYNLYFIHFLRNRNIKKISILKQIIKKKKTVQSVKHNTITKMFATEFQLKIILATLLN